MVSISSNNFETINNQTHKPPKPLVKPNALQYEAAISINKPNYILKKRKFRSDIETYTKINQKTLPLNPRSRRVSINSGKSINVPQILNSAKKAFQILSGNESLNGSRFCITYLMPNIKKIYNKED